MNPIELTEQDLEDYRKYKKISHKKLHVRLQCYASKFALNDCFEDMNELAKQGVYCVSVTIHTYESMNGETMGWKDFDLRIVNREDMREIRKRDYMVNTHNYHAHFFFEIPVVAQFTEKQVDKWQDWCYNKLLQQCEINKKKARQWLLQKEMQSDFE